MKRTCVWLSGLFLTAALMGCSQKEQQIEVKASNDPLFQARNVLQQYANGQPMTSEVSMFPQMVEDVRKVDAERAAVLEKGLADLQKAPANARAAKAKELLAKLQPSMK